MSSKTTYPAGLIAQGLKDTSMLKKVLAGPVVHDVKVTRIKGVGYGVRVLVDGQVNQEAVAPSRSDIGTTARGLLRMEDKCGNLSNFADRARHRVGEKEIKRNAKTT